ncbi:MAG: hypothetical protein HZC43_00280 [Nitrosomonadales bacterium]|nr:hypothetical protein [Nitrosomonadales bacterium]
MSWNGRAVFAGAEVPVASKNTASGATPAVRDGMAEMAGSVMAPVAPAVWHSTANGDGSVVLGLAAARSLASIG